MSASGSPGVATTSARKPGANFPMSVAPRTAATLMVAVLRASLKVQEIQAPLPNSLASRWWSCKRRFGRGSDVRKSHLGIAGPRGKSARCARGEAVVRFLQRAVLCEVGEDGADGDGFFNAGHDPQRAVTVAAADHVDVEDALEALCLRSDRPFSSGLLWSLLAPVDTASAGRRYAAKSRRPSPTGMSAVEQRMEQLPSRRRL